MGHQRDEWPFVSLVAWPPGWARERTAECIARAGGLDEATVRLRLGQAPPMVLAQLAAEPAQRIAAALVHAGGEAFAFRFADLAALGRTMKVREMRIVEGALALQLWNGVNTTLPTAAISMLVRAHLSRTVVERRRRPRLSASLMRTLDGIKAEIESAIHISVLTSDRLDIHLDGPGIYRIDGDRFGFGILGDLRGHGDKANTDSLWELLHHVAPHALMDHFYPLWRPPSRHHRLRSFLPDSPRDDPSFEFYSRWTHLVHRHVLSG